MPENLIRGCNTALCPYLQEDDSMLWGGGGQQNWIYWKAVPNFDVFLDNVGLGKINKG